MRPCRRRRSRATSASRHGHAGHDNRRGEHAVGSRPASLEDVTEPAKPRCSRPPPLAAGRAAGRALGGISEIGRNMTMFEYTPDGGARPRLLVVDCGMLLGKTNSPGVDLTLPDWSLLPRPARRHRRDRAHPRPRGPHRRAALPAARAPRHPADRLAAHPGADRGQARPAPDQARPAPGRRGRDDLGRPVGPRVLRGQPLDPGRARASRSGPAATRSCTPATSRWTRPRWTAGSPTCPASPGSATRASTCCWPTRPTPRCPGSSRASATSARSSPT